MKTQLILVGKTTNKHLATVIDDYVGRIGHYMPFSVVVVPELKNTKALSEEQQKEREGELILQKIKPTDTLVLLDEREANSAAWPFHNGCNASSRRRETSFSSSAARMVSQKPFTTVPMSSCRSRG